MPLCVLRIFWDSAANSTFWPPGSCQCFKVCVHWFIQHLEKAHSYFLLLFWQPLKNSVGVQGNLLALVLSCSHMTLPGIDLLKPKHLNTWFKEEVQLCRAGSGLGSSSGIEEASECPLCISDMMCNSELQQIELSETWYVSNQVECGSYAVLFVLRVNKIVQKNCIVFYYIPVFSMLLIWILYTMVTELHKTA